MCGGIAEDGVEVTNDRLPRPWPYPRLRAGALCCVMAAEERESWARRYGIAVGTVLLATGASMLLRPLVGAADSPLFVAAVVVTAWRAGIGPALAATMMSVVPLDLVMVATRESFSVESSVGRLAVFVFVSLFVGTAAAARRRSERERLLLLEREQLARLDAEAATRARDQFASMVVHELRTPLTAIMSWSNALASERLDSTDKRRALEAIQRNAALQARLIDDLVDLVQASRGNVSLRLGTVDLRDVIEAAVDSSGDVAASRGIRLDVHVEEGYPLIRGDAARLQQVVSNLLTNAIKHSERGATISVLLDSTPEAARLRVDDEGNGIAPEFLPYVFEPYRQAEGDISRSGFGLGLTIVRQLIDLHHGHVHASSDGVGKGACFTVILPSIPNEDWVAGKK